MSLATKYRPQTFTDGFVGQNITATILKKTIEKRKFKNAYLFAGASGCGKTTAARIFAKMINSQDYNPIELDAGSVGGVDNIREILAEASQRDLSGEYKVIIIDECQNLGGGKKENSPAWTALLKGLEECPKYTIYILCSTNPEKIPEAIMNRLQRFNFAPIAANDIKNRLLYICDKESFINYDQACDFISRTCKGCMREAITNLEKCAEFNTDLSLDNVKQVLNGLSFETMFKLTWALQQKNEADCISLVESLFNEGQNLKTFIDSYLEFVVDLSKFILFNNIELTNIPSYLASAENAVVQFTVKAENSLDYFNLLADWLLELKSMIKYDTDIKSTIIVWLVKFMRNN